MNILHKELIDPIGFDPTEAEVNFALCDMSQGRLASFNASLCGPSCRYARTLPTTFLVPEHGCDSEVSTMARRRITDPCYWTPHLPYLYDLNVNITLVDSSCQSMNHTIGLRRWEVDGRNLLLERRRTVMRGVVIGEESNIDLQAAHEAEVSLFIENPNESILQEASECGVMIVADLRSLRIPLTPTLIRLAWQPSLALVATSEEIGFYLPPAIKLCQVLSANNLTPEMIEPLLSCLMIEIEDTCTLPSWLSELEKPVLAIRRGTGFSDMHSARAACDRLQAELAPEFNLAGYFVAP